MASTSPSAVQLPRATNNFSLAALQRPQLSLLDSMLDKQHKKSQDFAVFSQGPRKIRDDRDESASEEVLVWVGSRGGGLWGAGKPFVLTMDPFLSHIEIGWREINSAKLDGVGRRLKDEHFGIFSKGQPDGLGMRRILPSSDNFKVSTRKDGYLWVLRQWTGSEDSRMFFDWRSLVQLSSGEKSTTVVTDSQGRVGVFHKGRGLVYGEHGILGLVWGQENRDCSAKSSVGEAQEKPKKDVKYGLTSFQSAYRDYDGSRYLNHTLMMHKQDARFTYIGEALVSSQISDLELPLPEGYGKLQSTATRPSTYIGYFKKGEKNGKGTESLPCGELYVGEFRQNLRWGVGCTVSKSGSRYIGDLSQNQQQGVGRFTQRDTEYLGEWRNGQQQGLGIIIDHLVCLGTLAHWTQGKISQYQFTFRVIDRKLIACDDLGLIGDKSYHQMQTLSFELANEKFLEWETQLGSYEAQIESIVHELEGKRYLLDKVDPKELTKTLKSQEIAISEEYEAVEQSYRHDYASYLESLIPGNVEEIDRIPPEHFELRDELRAAALRNQPSGGTLQISSTSRGSEKEMSIVDLASKNSSQPNTPLNSQRTKGGNTMPSRQPSVEVVLENSESKDLVVVGCHSYQPQQPTKRSSNVETTNRATDSASEASTRVRTTAETHVNSTVTGYAGRNLQGKKTNGTFLSEQAGADTPSLSSQGGVGRLNSRTGEIDKENIAWTGNLQMRQPDSVIYQQSAQSRKGTWDNNHLENYRIPEREERPSAKEEMEYFGQEFGELAVPVSSRYQNMLYQDPPQEDGLQDNEEVDWIIHDMNSSQHSPSRHQSEYPSPTRKLQTFNMNSSPLIVLRTQETQSFEQPTSPKREEKLNNTTAPNLQLSMLPNLTFDYRNTDRTKHSDPSEVMIVWEDEPEQLPERANLVQTAGEAQKEWVQNDDLKTAIWMKSGTEPKPPTKQSASEAPSVAGGLTVGPTLRGSFKASSSGSFVVLQSEESSLQLPNSPQNSVPAVCLGGLECPEAYHSGWGGQVTNSSHPLARVRGELSFGGRALSSPAKQFEIGRDALLDAPDLDTHNEQSHSPDDCQVDPSQFGSVCGILLNVHQSPNLHSGSLGQPFSLGDPTSARFGSQIVAKVEIRTHEDHSCVKTDPFSFVQFSSKRDFVDSLKVSQASKQELGLYGSR